MIDPKGLKSCRGRARQNLWRRVAATAMAIIVLTLIVGRANSVSILAESLCAAASYEQIVQEAKAVERKWPLSVANVLDYPHKQIAYDQHSIGVATGCPDEPAIVGQSYRVLSSWLAQALELERDVAMVPMIKAGLTLEPPACAALKAAEIRADLWHDYVHTWQYNPWSPAIMQAAPDFSYGNSIYRMMAAYLDLHLQQFGTPYRYEVQQRLYDERGAIARRMPPGVNCDQDHIARRGAKMSLTFVLAKRRLMDEPIAAVGLPPVLSSPLSLNNRTPAITKVPPQQLPQSAISSAYTVSVSNSWNDSAQGILYVHDTVVVQSARPGVVTPASFVLSMRLANGGIRRYNAMSGAAPTYRKINPLVSSTPIISYEVDPTTDLGRLRSFTVDGSATFTVTFPVMDAVADARDNRNVTIP